MFNYKVILMDGTEYEGVCHKIKRIIEINSIRKSPIKAAYFSLDALDAKETQASNDNADICAKIKNMTQKELLEFQKQLRSFDYG